MARILVTHPLPGEALNRLRRDHDVEVWPKGTPVDESSLIKAVPSRDALIVLLSHPVTSRVLKAGKNLKVVANYAVGTDNIDIDAAQRLKIQVTNTPEILTDATADLTLALILSVARRIIEGDRLVRKGHFSGWKPDLLLGTDLREKNLGIIGMGRIGRAVARRALGFGMRILYAQNHSLPLEIERELKSSRLELDALLSRSDILTLHLPLTPSTHHLLDERRLRLLPRGAILINTSRGPIVEESALVKLLEEGHLSGVGLDVYEEEPRVHPGLIERADTVLLPHLGSATRQTRRAMADLAVANVEAVLQGRPPLTPLSHLQ